MKISEENERLLLLCAFRYALGRMTYMPSTIAGIIKDNWGDISDSDKRLYKQEIREAIKHGMAGMDCDKQVWMTLLDMPGGDG